MVNRKDFRPSSRGSTGISQKDRDIIKSNKYNKQIKEEKKASKEYSNLAKSNSSDKKKLNEISKEEKTHAKELKQLQNKESKEKKYSKVEWENKALNELSQKNNEEIISHKQVDNHIEVETDGGEYIVFENSEDAEDYAKERVRQDLEDNPEYFTQSWLENFIYVGDTDKRIIAGEESDNYVDNLSDEDIISESKYDDEYENAKTEKEKDEVITTAREQLREEKYDEVYKGLDNPNEYFVEEQGIYTREELLKQNFISIDYDKASQDAIDTDGVGHFLATYDGDEIELKNGSYAYRTN